MGGVVVRTVLRQTEEDRWEVWCGSGEGGITEDAPCLHKDVCIGKQVAGGPFPAMGSWMRAG